MAQVNCGRLEIFMSQGKGGRYAKLLFRLNEQKCKIYTLLCGGCLFPATHEPSVLKSWAFNLKQLTGLGEIANPYWQSWGRGYLRKPGKGSRHSGSLPLWELENLLQKGMRTVATEPAGFWNLNILQCLFFTEHHCLLFFYKHRFRVKKKNQICWHSCQGNWDLNLFSSCSSPNQITPLSNYVSMELSLIMPT